MKIPSNHMQFSERHGMDDLCKLLKHKFVARKILKFVSNYERICAYLWNTE